MLAIRKHTRAVRGFTLTEAAIVLGIVGLILGAIWVAAASVYDNMRVQKANTQLLQIVQNVRALYANASSIGSTGDITTSLISAGIFPQDAVSGSYTVNPWSTASATNRITISSATSSGGTAGDSFNVFFTNVPKDGCSKLFAGVAAGSGTAVTGLLGIGNATSTNVLTTAVPANIATITTLCGSATANTVGFSFSLKG